MLRALVSMIWVTAFLLSSALSSFAGVPAQIEQKKVYTSVQQGKLAPAGSAGVKQAQFMTDHKLFIFFGLVIVGGGLALVFSGGGKGSTSTTTTGAP